MSRPSETNRLPNAVNCLIVVVAFVAGVRGENVRTNLTARSENYKVIYSISFSEQGDQDNDRLIADIYRPDGEGPFPTILMVHGGAWFAGDKAHVSLHARHAAERGFAVVAINYRLAPGHKFPAQLEDCRTALVWIRDNAKRYAFDTERIAAYGYSAGAHLVCLLGTSENEVRSSPDSTNGRRPPLRALVAGGAPCEFSWIPADSERLAFWLGGSRRDSPEIYLQASPLSFVDSEDPPIFLFHGTNDRIVPISSAERMKRALDAKRVPSSLYVVQGGSHFGTFINADARRSALAFLAKHMKLPRRNP